MGIAEHLVVLAGLYVWVGVAVAAAFLGWGVERIDPAARGAFLFRVLVAPGVVGLWPLVLAAWHAAMRRTAAVEGSGRAG